MTCTVRKVPHPQALFTAAAQEFSRIAQESIQRHGRMTVALAGGSTPKSLYSLLASEPYFSQVSWKNIQFFWGDERHVPPDHSDSNYRMAQESLLSKIPLSLEQIHRMQGELAKASEAAEQYEQELQKVFGHSGDSPPAFDLILLGMGPDGHTASLFPGTAAVHEVSRWVASPWVEKFHTHRVTLTPAVINQARHVMFLVAGEDKAEALRGVLEGPPQPDTYPSQVVRPTTGELLWLVDESATALLQKTSFQTL